MGSIDLDLQGHFGLKMVDFCKIVFFHALLIAGGRGVEHRLPMLLCLLDL